MRCRRGYIDPTDACPCISQPDPRTRFAFIVLVRQREFGYRWALNLIVLSVIRGVIIIIIIFDISLKKVLRLFVRIVFDTIARSDYTCRTRVSKLD